MPTYVVKHYSGWFWMSLTFRSIYWATQIASLMWMGLIWSSESLSISKCWPSLNKKEFFQHDCLWPAILNFFPLLNFNWDIGSSWILSLLAFMLELHQQPSRGSSACWLQVWGLASLRNCMSQLLIINLSLCMSVSVCLCTYTQTHILLVLFVWKTLTNIGPLKIWLYLQYKMECLNNFFSNWYLIDISKVYWWHLKWLLCSSIISGPYIPY